MEKILYHLGYIKPYKFLGWKLANLLQPPNFWTINCSSCAMKLFVQVKVQDTIVIVEVIIKLKFFHFVLGASLSGFYVEYPKDTPRWAGQSRVKHSKHCHSSLREDMKPINNATHVVSILGWTDGQCYLAQERRWRKDTCTLHTFATHIQIQSSWWQRSLRRRLGLATTTSASAAAFSLESRAVNSPHFMKGKLSWRRIPPMNHWHFCTNPHFLNWAGIQKLRYVSA